MASDPMLDDLRAAMEQQHDECPDHWSDCNRAKAFVRTHGPALLAKLEAMEKAVAEEREACAEIADAQAFAIESADDSAQAIHAAKPWRNLSAAIRARGQS